MFLTHLQLADFRSYPQVDVPLTDGVTTFVGANGQGKTNLVEAVEYLSTLSSHRVSSDTPLIRAGAERAVLRARVQAGRDDERTLMLEVELNAGKANIARLNRSPLKRPREIVGVLQTVVFSPEDLAIVKGDPSERRAFLDSVVIARWPRLAGVKADYERVLRQRNTLLKSLAGRSHRPGGPGADASSTLAVWDGHLAEHGAELVRCRLLTLTALMPYVAQAYAGIAPTNNDATAAYTTSLALEAGEPDREALRAAVHAEIAARRSDELTRGVTLVGPHRDDVTLSLGPLPARGYASHGESWSFALALRLGAFELLRADGIEPVLVLDDVFAELDVTRRARLADRIAPAEQVLITAAVGADVPAELRGQRYDVVDGQVNADAGQLA